METNPVAANERLSWVAVVAQGIVLVVLLWVGWTLRGIKRDNPRQPMTRTTEWVGPTGRTERFQSFRDGDEPFDDFRRRHEASVEALQR